MAKLSPNNDPQRANKDFFSLAKMKEGHVRPAAKEEKVGGMKEGRNLWREEGKNTGREEGAEEERVAKQSFISRVGSGIKQVAGRGISLFRGKEMEDAKRKEDFNSLKSFKRQKSEKEMKAAGFLKILEGIENMSEEEVNQLNLKGQIQEVQELQRQAEALVAEDETMNAVTDWMRVEAQEEEQRRKQAQEVQESRRKKAAEAAKGGVQKPGKTHTGILKEAVEDKIHPVKDKTTLVLNLAVPGLFLGTIKKVLGKLA